MCVLNVQVNRTLHEIGLTTPPCKLFEVLRQRSSMPSDPVRDWKEEVEVGNPCFFIFAYLQVFSCICVVES